MSNESLIQAFEGVNVRIVWDEEQQEYYFSIADIVQILTESVDVKQYIKRMRSRDPELDARWGTICTPTRMRAADGKYYRTQAATMEGVLRIVQSIPSKKAEPLKQWLAEVGSQHGGDVAKVARMQLESKLGRSESASPRQEENEKKKMTL